MNAITLTNGVTMPQLGLGTMQVNHLTQVIPQAIDLGYRLIDTAANYDNEEEVGAGIRNSNIHRNKLFITSKVKIQSNGYEGTLKAFNQTLQKLQLDYLDLYLIHQPYGDISGEWCALEKLYTDGKVRAIGVSNFAPFQLMDLTMHSQIKPMLNQIEMHPFFQEVKETEYCLENAIQPESWAPFGEKLKELNNLPTLKNIATNHHKTVAQVILRWLIQRNVIVIPRSDNADHLKNNIEVFNFVLTSQEMDSIKQLDTNHSIFIDHLTAEGAEFLSKVN